MYILRDMIYNLHLISCELKSRNGYPNDIYFNEEYVYKFRDAYIKAIAENKDFMLPDFEDCSKEECKAFIENIYDNAARIAYKRPVVLDGSDYYSYNYLEPDTVETLTEDSIYAITQNLKISRNFYVKVAKEYEVSEVLLESLMVGDQEFCNDTISYYSEKLAEMENANKYQTEHGLELDYSEYVIQDVKNRIFKLEKDKSKIDKYLEEIDKIMEDSKKRTFFEKIKGIFAKDTEDQEEDEEEISSK